MDIQGFRVTRVLKGSRVIVGSKDYQVTVELPDTPVFQAIQVALAIQDYLDIPGSTESQDTQGLKEYLDIRGFQDIQVRRD